jgi:pyrroline-5-carboxylate reductase
MKIGFIGMGNMASALASGWIQSHYLKASDVYAYDVSQKALQQMQEQVGIQICDSLETLVSTVEIVVLAVKPNVVEGIIVSIKELLSNKAVISIVAGYNFEQYQLLFKDTTRHLSVMPNTPAKVLEGVTILEQEYSLTQEEFVFVKGMFESIGLVEVLPSYLMSTGGAISGCGPAFMYMVIEALADGGVMGGLPRATAYRLASQTMIGAGMMQLKTSVHPGVLKDQVCSPGGITIKGVKELEEAGIRSAFMKAVKNAK